MKYRILKGKFGEGWKPGDIVDMDFRAARVRQETGDIEIYKEENFKCDECDFVAKNVNGLRLHKRKHLNNK